MTITERNRMRLAILTLGVVTLVLASALTGCGGDDSGAALGNESSGLDDSSSDQGEELEQTEPADNAEVPNACTFIDRDEMASLIGYQLDDGELEEEYEGMTQCDFDTPPLMYVTTTYPNPALEASVGFSSVTITTNPATADSFAEFREMLGPNGEDVSGIGDGAYFYGPDLIYVRVGDVGFSIRIYTAAETDDDWSQVRDVMLALADLGARKLQ